MYLCVCKAVSEQRARMAVNAGARSLRDLHHQLGVGGCCGRCIPEAQKLLRDAQPIPLAAVNATIRADLAA